VDGSMRALFQGDTYTSVLLNHTDGNVPRSNRCLVTSTASSDNPASPFEARR